MRDTENEKKKTNASADGESGREKSKVSAFDAAAKYLSLSPRSEKEVRERLYKKGYHKSEVEDAIARAKHYGYIDDVRYVADFVEYYGGKLGRKKMEYKLVAEKGVAREIVLNGIADAVSDEDEREKALGIARKYVVAGRITERKDLGKVGAYLWQRGFGRSTIDEVIPTIADELGGEMFPDA